MLICVWTVGERSALWHLAFGIGKSGRAGKLHAHPPKSKVEGWGRPRWPPSTRLESAQIGAAPTNSAIPPHSAWEPIPGSISRDLPGHDLRRGTLDESPSPYHDVSPRIERREDYANSPLSMVIAMASFLVNARFTPTGTRPSPAGHACALPSTALGAASPSPSPCHTPEMPVPVPEMPVPVLDLLRNLLRLTLVLTLMLMRCPGPCHPTGRMTLTRKRPGPEP